jgi:hypothetical protein
MNVAQDAMLRDQIVGSCRLITRHVEGVVSDAQAIVTMPHYKTEAQDALNKAEHVISLAAQAISAAKAEMEKKALETT